MELSFDTSLVRWLVWSVDLSVGEKKMLIVLAYLANLKSLKPALKTLTGCIFETTSIVNVLINRHALGFARCFLAETSFRERHGKILRYKR